MDREARLQILCVSKRLPVGNANHAGGQITYYYLRSVAQWADLDLISVVTPAESPSDLPEVRSYSLVRSNLDTNASSLKGMVVRAVAYCRLLARAIQLSRSRGYDLLILERSALGWIAPIVRRMGGVTNVLLIVHDFWFDRLEADAASLGSPRSRYYALLSRLAYAVEVFGIGSASGIVCYDYRTENLILKMQERESDEANRAPVLLMPPYFSAWTGSQQTKSGICFYGNMSRSVNWQSAKWFIDRALPKIRATMPMTTLSIVGADPPPELSEYDDGKDIVVTGFVDDPSRYLASAEVFVAPLISGTGIKIKVLEAMASGVPVVANDIAMQGIPARAGRDYLHAQSATEFAAQSVKLLQNGELRAAVADRARELIASRFSLTDANERQHRFIERLIENGAELSRGRHRRFGVS